MVQQYILEWVYDGPVRVTWEVFIASRMIENKPQYDSDLQILLRFHRARNLGLQN